MAQRGNFDFGLSSYSRHWECMCFFEVVSLVFVAESQIHQFLQQCFVQFGS